MRFRYARLATSLMLTLVLLAGCSTGDDGPTPTPTIDPLVLELQTAVVGQASQVAEDRAEIAARFTEVSGQAATSEAQAAERDEALADEAATSEAKRAATSKAQQATIAAQSTQIASADRAAAAQATAIAAAEETAEAQAAAANERIDAQATAIANADATVAAQQDRLTELEDIAAENDATIAAQSTVIVAQATRIAGQDDAIDDVEDRINDVEGQLEELATVIASSGSRSDSGDTGGGASNWPSGALEEGIQGCIDEGQLTAAECTCILTFLSNNVDWNDLMEAFDYYDANNEFPDWFLIILYDAQAACF